MTKGWGDNCTLAYEFRPLKILSMVIRLTITPLSLNIPRLFEWEFINELTTVHHITRSVMGQFFCNVQVISSRCNWFASWSEAILFTRLFWCTFSSQQSIVQSIFPPSEDMFVPNSSPIGRVFEPCYLETKWSKSRRWKIIEAFNELDMFNVQF